MSETRDQAMKRLFVDEAAKTVDQICDHLTEGGNLIELSVLWDVKYSAINNFMNLEVNKTRYYQALDGRTEWIIQRILMEIKSIGLVDIRKLFNDDHSLKAPKDWPDDIAASIAGLDVAEIWDTELEDGKKRKVQSGEMKKIKLHDKLKALELLGKDLGRFIQKHEISGKVTLEDLVNGSIKKDATTPATP